MIPDLVKHWRGKFFSETAALEIRAVDYDADDESDHQEDLVRAPNKRRLKQAKSKQRSKQKNAPTTKFVKADDLHNIPPDEWAAVGGRRRDEPRCI